MLCFSKLILFLNLFQVKIRILILDKMITILEILPNEILCMIFSNLSSIELLTSLWPLNKRFEVLICSFLSRIDNQFNSGLIIVEPGLSFMKCYSIFASLILNSSSPIVSCIRRIHLDGTNSNVCDYIYEWLYDNKKNTSTFPSLKSFILTQCLLTESLIKALSILIKYQLDELTLLIDEDADEFPSHLKRLGKSDIHTGN
jgi:hypothetical protein